MKKTITLILSHILEAVKGETYIKGTIDRSTAEGAEKFSFHETAGDRVVHEKKLSRCIYTSTDKLRAALTDYVISENYSTGDNIITTIDKDNDTITITLDIDSRSHTVDTDSMARIMSKYIEDNTLYLWYGTFNQQQAAFYLSLVTEDMLSIQRMFMKGAPSSPTYAYTKEIGGIPSDLTLTKGEQETLTYTLDDGAIDDIELKVSDWHNIEYLRETGHRYSIYAKNAGYCRVTLFSRHNTEVTKTIDVTISE